MDKPVEVWYPTPEDLGIDEGMRRRMAAVILDTSIEIPPSERSNRGNYNQWNEESLTNYGIWLFGVLHEEDESIETLAVWMMNRASKLGIGPSESLIWTDESIGSFTRYQEMIDTKPEKPFLTWTRAEYIERGLELTKQHGRLTRSVLNRLSREGVFPGDVAVRSRFSNIRHFHELTGKPSVRGWRFDDYLDWGIAFMQQNPGMRITRDAVLELSARQVGPSDRAIRENVGGIIEFREFVEAAFTEHELEEDARQQAIRMQLEDDLHSGRLPKGLLDPSRDKNYLRIFGLYKLADSLLSEVSERDMVKIARTNNPDDAVRKISELDHGITIGEVEVKAEELGVFDDIWPMNRFQNVDLRIAA